MNEVFLVTGMSCGHCEMAIKKAILRLDPEAKVDIDRDAGTVNIHSSKSRDELALAIEDEGYTIV